MVERREFFLSGRIPLLDEAFLLNLECRGNRERQWALFLRRLLGMICSIHPEMIFPSDRTEHLERIMDWGQGLFGYWLESVDCGEWNDGEFWGNLTRDLRRWCPEFDGYKHDWYVPPFGRFDKVLKGRCPETVGEWISETARILVEVVPAACQDRIPEYPEGTEEFFSKPAHRETA